jgi:hypothetical protein
LGSGDGACGEGEEQQGCGAETGIQSDSFGG